MDRKYKTELVIFTTNRKIPDFKKEKLDAKILGYHYKDMKLNWRPSVEERKKVLRARNTYHKLIGGKGGLRPMINFMSLDGMPNMYTLVLSEVDKR
uniref:Uncharacterized protein n=1 Tax=Megaselia scalaris TaxID=36166 RepID=T1GCX9_MEGSC